MANLHIGFIGLGLIGGSIARALRDKVEGVRISAYDINKETLAQALSDGVINNALSAIDAQFSTCDFIFLCAPVQKNDANLVLIKDLMSPDCILTDVGSVKTNIHKHIIEMGLEERFIGGHPMAGTERVGYKNSKSRLLENAYYIITPTAKTSQAKLDAYTELVKQIGAIPITLDYEQHDYVTAGISHLPHVVAASLVNLVQDSDSEEGIMKLVAAGGFKDITRIASSSSSLWQQICTVNKENIAPLLEKYIGALQDILDKIQSDDTQAIYDFFAKARVYRDSFINASSGPIKRVYSFNVEIDDKPGVLAGVATTLALAGISIKNIGIVHNREQEDGVLRIELYEEDAVDAAIKLLKSHNYIIHEKSL